MKNVLFCLFSLFLPIFTTISAQTPKKVSGQDENFIFDLSSTADILIYIVLPIIILLLLLFRIKKKKK